MCALVPDNVARNQKITLSDLAQSCCCCCRCQLPLPHAAGIEMWEQICDTV